MPARSSWATGTRSTRSRRPCARFPSSSRTRWARKRARASAARAAGRRSQMDIYSTGALVRVVESLDVPVPFLLNRYFTLRQQSENEKIYFDRKDKKRRLAPFVSPLVEGKVVEA